LASFRAVWL